jgi:hypothetical protein
MATATDRTPTDTVVSQPRREVSFAARRDTLRLTKVARYPVRDQSGQKIDETHGVVIKFQDGMLRIPTEGKVKTEQGRDVDAAEIVAWLKQHPLNGDMHEGFWPIPQAIPLISGEEQERITQAAIMHDVETLDAILKSERAGWNRYEVVSQIERAVDQIEIVQEQVRQQIEAEQAEKPAAKRPAR